MFCKGFAEKPPKKVSWSNSETVERIVYLLKVGQENSITY